MSRRHGFSDHVADSRAEAGGASRGAWPGRRGTLVCGMGQGVAGGGEALGGAARAAAAAREVGEDVRELLDGGAVGVAAAERAAKDGRLEPEGGLGRPVARLRGTY